MTYLILIVFEVCVAGSCRHEQIFAEMPAEVCLADKAGFAAGRAANSVLTVEDGPDAGQSYPVVSVDCIPPGQTIEVCEPGTGPEQSLLAAYPQRQ